MSKLLKLAFSLLLTTAWLQAQEPSPGQTPAQTPPSTSGQTHSRASSGMNKTVEGCLQGSNGSFTITDRAGKTYQLAGDTSKLTDHVGHEVQITGSTSGSDASASSTTPGAASGGQEATINVEKIKHVSKTCAAGSAAPKQ